MDEFIEARNDHNLIVGILLVTLINMILAIAILWRVFDLSL